MSKLKQKCSRACAAVALCCATLVAVVWIVTVQRIVFEQRSDLSDAVRQNSNLALALEQHTLRTVKAVDQALLFLKHEYEEDRRRPDIASLAAAGQLDGAAFTAIFVVDQDGSVIGANTGSTRVDFTGDSMLEAHRAGASRGLLISEPRNGRFSGAYTIPFSRRLAGPDGAFRGMVVAGVSPEHFSKFYDLVDLRPGAVVQLVGLDGILRARRTGTQALSGSDMRNSSLLALAARGNAGNFESLGRLDGVPRFMSYRKLSDLGLLIAVGSSKEQVLAQTYARRAWYLLGSALATLFVVLFGGGLIVAIQRQQRAMDRAVAGERLYRVAMQEAAVGVAHQRLDGGFLRANPRYCEMVGYSEAELTARRFQDLLHPEDAPTREEIEQLMSTGRLEREARHVRKDGTLLWGLVAVAVVRDAAGKPDYTVAMVQDISARKAAERRALEAEAPYRATFEQGAAGIAHCTLDGRFVKVNGRFAAMLGYGERELLGRCFADVTHSDDAALSRECASALLARPTEPQPPYEKRYLRKDGATLWAEVCTSLVLDTQGNPAYFIAMAQDITARKEAESRLAHQAHYDLLTDLPNRALLFDRLTQALTQARRKGWTAGLLCVNLDRFKAVNESLGHAKGDRLLRQAAARLAAVVRPGDTVARVGGDEFAVALAEIAAPEHAALVARKVLEAMAKPLKSDGEEVFLTASIGIATFPADGADVERLISNADAAMRRAKQMGRGNYQFYTAAMNRHTTDRLKLEADLRRALERDEFRLHFQPRASIDGGKVVGFEALLRWQRGAGRLAPPADFIALLEESGLIVPVGEWVIRAACAQIRAWQDAGFAPSPVAVNIAAKQFLSGELAEVIDRALREHGIDARLLEIEITESDAMLDPAQTVATLETLRARGIRVAIDDFGTGYSSLGYLKRFPVDFLKLDRSFVTGLPADADDASIARAVIAMAHSLDLKVVAEGVENEEQRAFLARKGCDQMQGYLLSRPLPAAECAPYLKANPRPAQEQVA